jgi:hypothetical protein
MIVVKGRIPDSGEKPYGARLVLLDRGGVKQGMSRVRHAETPRPPPVTPFSPSVSVGQGVARRDDMEARRWRNRVRIGFLARSDRGQGERKPSDKDQEREGVAGSSLVGGGHWDS